MQRLAYFKAELFPKGPAFLTSLAIACVFSIAPMCAYGDGQVVSWGSDTLGVTVRTPTSILSFTDIAGGFRTSMALKVDGTIVAWGDNTFGLCEKARSYNSITQVACGEKHASALRIDGTVVTWGSTLDSISVVPSTLNSVTQIACGSYNTMALTKDGTITCWGKNNYGQCLGTNAIGSAITSSTTGQTVQIQGCLLQISYKSLAVNRTAPR